MDEIDLSEYLRIIMGRRRLIAVLACGAALITLVILLIMPSTYRGRAVLIFPQQAQSATSGLLSRLAGLPVISDLGLAGGNGPGMYTEILKSKTLSEQVLSDLRLSSVGVDPKNLQEQIDVGVSKDGGMEVCCYASTSWAKRLFPGRNSSKAAAQLAADMTNTYIRRLQDFDRRHSLNTGHRNRIFLEGEVAKTRRQLSEAEDELRRFQESHPVVPPPEAASKQIEQVIDIRSKQIEAEAELGEAERSIQEARSVIADQKVIESAAKIIQENPVVTELKAQLAQAEVRRAKLLENMTETHPDIVAATQEIEKIEKKIGQEVGRVVASETLQINPVRQALVQDLAGLEIKKSGVEARLGALNTVMARVEREISNLAKDEMSYVRLLREVKALEVVYTSLLTQLSQAKVAEAKEPDGFTVLDIAAPEKHHFSPNIKVTVAAAFILGLMAGSFVALILEGRRPTKRQAARAPQVPS